MIFLIYALLNVATAFVGALITSYLAARAKAPPAQSFVPPDVTTGTTIPLACGTVRARPIITLVGQVRTEVVKAQTGSAFFGLIPITQPIGNRYRLTAMGVLCHGAVTSIRNVVFGDNMPLTDLPPTMPEVTSLQVHEGFLGFGTTVDVTFATQQRMRGGVDAFTFVLHGGREMLEFYCPTVYGGEVPNGGGGVTGNIEIFCGGGQNGPCGYLEPIVGMGNLPSYKDLAYVVFEDTNIGMRPTAPPMDFIVVVQSFNDPSSGHAFLDLAANINPRTIISRSAMAFVTYGADATWDMGDANPIAAALMLLTHRFGGLARPLNEIDLADWDSVANQVADDNIGVSFITQGTRAAAKERLNEMFQIAGAVPRRNPANNKLQIKLIRAEDPGAMRVVDRTQVVDADLAQSQLLATFNEVTVWFSNADKLFEQDFVTVRNRGNVAATGSIRPAPDIRLPSITYYPLALQVAVRELKAVSVPAYAGTLKLTRSCFDIERGDVCLYDIPWLGFDDDAGHYGRIALRATAVNLGSPKDNTVNLTVAQDLFSLADPVVDVVDTPTTAPLGSLPAARTPQIIPTQRDDGVTGWLDLVIIDPDGSVVAVTMSELVGGDTSASAFHSITGVGNVYEGSVALSTTGQSQIAYKVLYGDMQTIAGSVLFPAKAATGGSVSTDFVTSRDGMGGYELVFDMAGNPVTSH
jgi:hypothetical protein